MNYNIKMRLVSLFAICIVGVYAARATPSLKYGATPASLNYCKNFCIGVTEWSPDDCLQECVSYYDVNPLPSEPSYPDNIVVNEEQSQLPKQGLPK